MKHPVLLFLFLLVAITLPAQQGLVAGPMAGFTDLREVRLWFQFDQPGERTVYAWPEDKPYALISAGLSPDPLYGNSATAILSGLEPATLYRYALDPPGSARQSWSFRTQVLWQYRNDPPPFRLALGSCTYINETAYDRPGKPYGGDYQIFDTIAARKPDLMLWLGDNVYFRETDWNSRSGMVHRYSHARRLPDLQRLLHTGAHLAIWDDHDFGPNDATGNFVHKEEARDVFMHFWANPTYGLPATRDGITTAFNWADIDFFLLDNRWNRAHPGTEGVPPAILGMDQIQWLIQSLKQSRAPFKLVALGGQFLNPAAVYENFSTVPRERDLLLRLIEENKITGVVFLSGDRHSTELSMHTLPNGIEVYDLTTSPLTSTAYDPSNEENGFRIQGTMVTERNFTTIDFSGPLKQRKAVIRAWNAKGQMLWEKTIQTPAQP